MGVSDRPIPPTEESYTGLSNLCFGISGVAFVICVILLATGTSSTNAGGLISLQKVIAIILFVIALVFLGLGLVLCLVYGKLKEKK